MTVKESFNVVGLSTTFGNPLWKGTSIAEPRCRVRTRLAAGGNQIRTRGPVSGGEPARTQLPEIG
jgi:hypothetical protein